MLRYIFLLATISLVYIDSFALSPTRHTCANLKKYQKLLREKKAGYLEKHPNCNAAAIKAAFKNKENKDFWINEIEGLYRAHFGYPSSLFDDCLNCVSSAPIHTIEYYKEKLKDKEYIFVLSLDGGGIRGIFPAKILQYIKEKTGQDITKSFDIFLGTSTGGLIALFLNAPNEEGKQRYTIDELVKLYRGLPKKIFSHSNIIRKIRGANGILTAQYSAKPYESYLKKHFGNTMLNQTICPVVVTSFDLIQGNADPFHFSTLDAADNPQDNYFLWQAARATSAAPTYFKPLYLKDKRTDDTLQLVDGGVGVNNPVSLAIGTVKRFFPDKKIVIVSLGTGFHISKKRFKGRGALGGGALSGFGKNISFLIETLINAPNSHIARLVERELKNVDGYYFIINPRLPKEIALDSVATEDMQMLEKVADAFIHAAEKTSNEQKNTNDNHTDDLNYIINLINSNKKGKMQTVVEKSFESSHIKLSKCTEEECPYITPPRKGNPKYSRGDF